MKPLTQWRLHVSTPPSAATHTMRYLETDFGDLDRHYSVVAEIRTIDDLTVGQNIELARAFAQLPRLVALDELVRELVPLLKQVGIYNLYVAPEGSHHRTLCTPEQQQLSDLLVALDNLS